jgi:hypothetical protein
MLKINRENRSFSVLDTPTLADVLITERYDLQEYIANSPDAFFKEIGQDLFLIGKEVQPSKNVQDRIDLLAVDKEGITIVIELKRSNHKLHMLQAISYAGMISPWELDDFLQLLDEDQQEALSDFLEVDRNVINQQQRIILVAEAYDYALLIGAAWLSEHYGVDIICCRIALAKDSLTETEYLVCSNVYPAPELAKEALLRGRDRTGTSQVKWTDWEMALSGITNNALVSYFKQELAASRESYLPHRALRYRIADKRRWSMEARNQNVYVWQTGRFEGDVEFWQHGLSKPDGVKPIKNEECVRLFLHTTDDFQFFHDAVTEKLQSIKWLSGAPEEDQEETEEF